jgi:hypothetical protein
MAAGLIGFRVEVAPGAATEVTVYFSRAASDDAGWYKYDPVTGWSDYSANVEFASDRKSVVIGLTDGGEGDLDGVVNGIIVDPSGPDMLALENTDSSGGGDGGCFIGLVALDGGYRFSVACILFSVLMVSVGIGIFRRKTVGKVSLSVDDDKKGA